MTSWNTRGPYDEDDTADDDASGVGGEQETTAEEDPMSLDPLSPLP